MECERCGGFTVRELAYSRKQAGVLIISRCFICRHRFGEPVIDFHHRTNRPEPLPENTLPVFRGFDYWGERLREIGKVC